MKNLKAIGLLATLTSTFLPSQLFASKSPPVNDKDQKENPTVPQKAGRETARVIGQVEDAGRSVAKGFKKQRHKDQKEKKKEENQTK